MAKGIPKIDTVETKVFFDEGYLGIKKGEKILLSTFMMKDGNERTRLIDALNSLIKQI